MFLPTLYSRLANSFGAATLSCYKKLPVDCNSAVVCCRSEKSLRQATLVAFQIDGDSIHFIEVHAINFNGSLQLHNSNNKRRQTGTKCVYMSQWLPLIEYFMNHLPWHRRFFLSRKTLNTLLMCSIGYVNALTIDDGEVIDSNKILWFIWIFVQLSKSKINLFGGNFSLLKTG